MGKGKNHVINQRAKKIPEKLENKTLSRKKQTKKIIIRRAFLCQQKKMIKIRNCALKTKTQLCSSPTAMMHEKDNKL